MGTELGRRLHCTSLSWLRQDLSEKNEGVLFSLYDALWWSNQLSQPSPLMGRGVALPVTYCGLELSVGSANVRTLSPATDELEVHSVRRWVLAEAFSKKKKKHRCCRFARDVHAQFDFPCLLWVFTWSPWLSCLGRVFTWSPWLSCLGRVFTWSPWLSCLGRVFTWSPWLSCLGREGWELECGIV